MQINMTINSEELIEAASKMPLDEKLRLFDKIKDEILSARLDAILDQFKSNDITEEEITAIVKDVRAERYKNRR